MRIISRRSTLVLTNITLIISQFGSADDPDSCWPISFKFDVPQNVIVKADSTDTMSTVGNSSRCAE